MNMDDELRDPLLQHLVKKIPMEKPAEGFTVKVMNRIMEEERPVHAGIFLRWQDYYLYLAGIAAAAVVILLVYFNYGQATLLSDSGMINPATAGKVLMSFKDGFSGLFGLIERVFSSSILVVVMISIAFLYLADRIIRYFSPSRGYLFIY